MTAAAAADGLVTEAAAAADGLVTGVAAVGGATVAAAAAVVAVVTLYTNAVCSNETCSAQQQVLNAQHICRQSSEAHTAAMVAHRAAVAMQGPHSWSPRTGRAASRRSWTRCG